MARVWMRRAKSAPKVCIQVQLINVFRPSGVNTEMHRMSQSINTVVHTPEMSRSPPLESHKYMYLY